MESFGPPFNPFNPLYWHSSLNPSTFLKLGWMHDGLIYFWNQLKVKLINIYLFAKSCLGSVQTHPVRICSSAGGALCRPSCVHAPICRRHADAIQEDIRPCPGPRIRCSSLRQSERCQQSIFGSWVPYPKGLTRFWTCLEAAVASLQPCAAGSSFSSILCECQMINEKARCGPRGLQIGRWAPLMEFQILNPAKESKYPYDISRKTIFLLAVPHQKWFDKIF